MTPIIILSREARHKVHALSIPLYKIQRQASVFMVLEVMLVVTLREMFVTACLCFFFFARCGL